MTYPGVCKKVKLWAN